MAEVHPRLLRSRNGLDWQLLDFGVGGAPSGAKWQMADGRWQTRAGAFLKISGDFD
jgi:hypothetical protein